MDVQHSSGIFTVYAIGFISSDLKDLKDCPLQESENAPAAYIDFNAAYAEGIRDLEVGNKLCVLTWLHLADRTVLKCHMRKRVGTKAFGVFSTRSPDRPNPIGLHIVTVVEVVSQHRIKIFPIEALHGTPVIDIKPVL